MVGWGQTKIKDHLSPAKAGIWAEFDSLFVDIKSYHLLKFIMMMRFIIGMKFARVLLEVCDSSNIS